MAFHSKKINPIKYNYKIYNKKQIAIIYVFGYLYPKFKGSTHFINIVIEYKNLKYLIIIK